MVTRRSCGFLVLLLCCTACDRPQPTGTDIPPAAQSTVPAAATTPTAAPSTAKVLPAVSLPKPTTERVSARESSTQGQLRVSIRKVSRGRVSLREPDGTWKQTEESRLIIALRIENLHEKRPVNYNTWGPDLDDAKSVARLTTDAGTEVKRVTFGFGNNVKDRTVLDTIAPGKIIGDVLVFELPAVGFKHLDLDLPGASSGQRGTFQFRILPEDIAP